MGTILAWFAFLLALQIELQGRMTSDTALFFLEAKQLHVSSK